ncbi:MAG: hypothetical protein AAF773_00940 [Cyanobacteria bacterium P01_D01_bin.115]
MTTPKRKLNDIHLVGGEKGGVGKTFISRALCQYLSTLHKQYALVEADSQIDDVGRIYKSQAAKTATITLSDDPTLESEPDIIFNLAENYPVLVNLPSNTLDVLENWMSKVSLLQLMQQEYDGNYLVKWFVSDGCYESIRQLERSIGQFDNAIPHIVVLNAGRLNGRDFGYLKNTETYQSICKAPNFVAEVQFPAMESAVQYFIDAHELTLEQAMGEVQGELGILAKQRVKTFIDTLGASFEQAFAALSKPTGAPKEVLSSSPNGHGKRESVAKDPTATEVKGQKVASKG